MLWLLILGVLLWSVVHLFPSALPLRRKAFVEQYGDSYKLGFTVAIVVALIFIVIGWRNTVPDVVYIPPTWGRHVTMLFMLLAIIVFGASHYTNTRIRTVIRNPMLTGVLLWAIGHLLANGDERSLTLFGGLGLWAAASIYFINQRDGAWQKPKVNASWQDEAKFAGVSLLVYLGLIFLHPYFAGVSPMASG